MRTETEAEARGWPSGGLKGSRLKCGQGESLSVYSMYTDTCAQSQGDAAVGPGAV